MTLLIPRHRSLILGGVKSGKSGHAEKLAEHYSKTNASQVILIATATAEDDEMRHRIERHKKDRNPRWLVVEEPVELGDALANAEIRASEQDRYPCIVVDCLTLWMTNLLTHPDESRPAQEIDRFKQAVEDCQSHLIIVSNEVNMGITPMGELSRRFCDEIGLLHQFLGSTCEHVALMVAGNALNIKLST